MIVNQSIRGKVAIVTGASSGIGRAIARLFAAEGARLALAARSTDKLEKLAGEIGPAPLILSIDLAQPVEVERMVAETLAHFGRVDVLMANAGVYIPGEAAEGDPSAWDNLLAVNVSSVFRSVRAVLPGMIAQGSGDIIVTSSIAGHQALRGSPSTARPSMPCRLSFTRFAARSHRTTFVSGRWRPAPFSTNCGA